MIAGAKQQEDKLREEQLRVTTSQEIENGLINDLKQRSEVAEEDFTEARKQFQKVADKGGKSTETLPARTHYVRAETRPHRILCLLSRNG